MQREGTRPLPDGTMFDIAKGSMSFQEITCSEYGRFRGIIIIIDFSSYDKLSLEECL